MTIIGGLYSPPSFEFQQGVEGHNLAQQLLLCVGGELSVVECLEGPQRRAAGILADEKVHTAWSLTNGDFCACNVVKFLHCWR